MNEESVRKRFGRLVADAARRTGRYDIDSPRGGGKTALARDTGLSESAIGRMLRGETLPEPRHFAAIADAVKLDVRWLLIEAGILPHAYRPSGNSSTPVETDATGVGSRSITPSEAADALGITDPVAREMLYGTIERLRRLQDADGGPASDNGGTAAQM
ncbi:helix-turn-helix domain-containing protein [Streptomyces sp. NPDC057910]|uniref:helix-turn-helix domain-containing protein n=1 Tax=Streptomyces sp. NPDC057910 TaxID=3346278 RepID=UPI0036E74C4D